MKRYVQLGCLLLFGAAMLVGCRKDLDPVPPLAKEIFPIVEGKSRVYHVIDTIYASASLMEARHYYKRETTEGTETDLLDREVSKLFLYTSPDTLDTLGQRLYDWQFSELWTQYLSEQYAERIEGNTRKLVLKWPPYPDATWNGNLYNSQEAQTYQYVNIDTTVVVDGRTYEHCVFVLQVPFRMPVEKIPGNPPPPFFLIEHAYEIYAPKIGKIVGYYKFYEEQVISGSVQVDEDSRVYYEELVEHDY